MSYRTPSLGRFYRWVCRQAARDPGATVGIAGDAAHCPLATYLAQRNPRTLPAVSGHTFSLHSQHCKAAVWAHDCCELACGPLEEWAEYFVAYADDLGIDKKPYAITAQQAKEILRSWHKLQRLNRP